MVGVDELNMSYVPVRIPRFGESECLGSSGDARALPVQSKLKLFHVDSSSQNPF